MRSKIRTQARSRGEAAPKLKNILKVLPEKLNKSASLPKKWPRMGHFFANFGALAPKLGDLWRQNGVQRIPFLAEKLSTPKVEYSNTSDQCWSSDSSKSELQRPKLAKPIYQVSFIYPILGPFGPKMGLEIGPFWAQFPISRQVLVT